MARAAAPKTRTTAKRQDPKTLPPEKRGEAFSRDLDRLLAKYDLQIVLGAELVPASTDGTLGIRPTLRFQAQPPQPQTTPEVG